MHECLNQKDIDKLKEESNPTWVRKALIAIILTILGAGYTVQSVFATKCELEKVETRLVVRSNEIKIDLNDKIEVIKADIINRLIRIEKKLDDK